MKNVAGLLRLAFTMAHNISVASLELEAAPGLRGHRVFADQIADSGVSALTYLAAATADFEESSYTRRRQVAESLRGARAELRKLRQALHSVQGQHYLAAEPVDELLDRVDELSLILTALFGELSGNRLLAA